MAKKSTYDGRVWLAILDFNVNLDSQLTSKSNFIFGASTLIFIFILSKVITEEFIKSNFIINIPWFILIIGSFLASLLSMLVVLPKLRILSKKERIKKDIFYYKNIIKFYSRKSYYKFIKDLPTNNNKIAEAYSNQIYSLANNILPYKFKMLKFSGWTLIISIILSGVSYFFILLFV